MDLEMTKLNSQTEMTKLIIQNMTISNLGCDFRKLKIIIISFIQCYKSYVFAMLNTSSQMHSLTKSPTFSGLSSIKHE